MYKFLTSKKGFTLVELMIVLALLSLGAIAVGNLFLSAYRSFNKTEERYVKQEDIKKAAELLRKGQTNVASANNADIFNNDYSNASNVKYVVPQGETVDNNYSYLFAEPHNICSVCKADWNIETNACTKACSGAKIDADGYLLKCLNKSQKLSGVKPIIPTPVYIEIEPIQQLNPGATEESNQCGVIITLSALEDDFDYMDDTGNYNTPTSDDVYYSLEVAYHFPNMVLSEENRVVSFENSDAAQTYAEATTITNEMKNTLSKATVYNKSGDVQTGAISAESDKGFILRVSSDAIISGDSSDSVLSTPKLCFIATASYGQDSGEVGMLCDFRDKVLLTNPLGEAFVKTYYKLSPPIADFIAESEFLKGAVRTALKPLIVVAEYSLNEDIRPTGAASLAVFMLSGLGTTLVLMKVDKRKRRSK